MPRAFYQSKCWTWARPRPWGPLRWTGFKDDEGYIEIRTRSGSDPDPDRYWRFTGRGDEQTFLDDEGQPLTRAAYQSLSFGQVLSPQIWTTGCDWVGGLLLRRQLGDPHDLVWAAALRTTTDRFRHQGRGKPGDSS